MKRLASRVIINERYIPYDDEAIRAYRYIERDVERAELDVLKTLINETRGEYVTSRLTTWYKSSLHYGDMPYTNDVLYDTSLGLPESVEIILEYQVNPTRYVPTMSIAKIIEDAVADIEIIKKRAVIKELDTEIADRRYRKRGWMTTKISEFLDWLTYVNFNY